MAGFSKGIPRWIVLSFALAMFVALPPETLSRGPDICLWKHLFHLACPGCGSTRALAALFHGRFAQALAYNRNVLVTGPLLIGLLIHDASRMVVQIFNKNGSDKLKSVLE